MDKYTALTNENLYPEMELDWEAIDKGSEEAEKAGEDYYEANARLEAAARESYSGSYRFHFDPEEDTEKLTILPAVLNRLGLTITSDVTEEFEGCGGPYQSRVVVAQ